MADRRAVLRVIDELLWWLRRGGVVIAPTQAIDAVRAVEAVGLEDGGRVEGALAAVLVHDRKGLPRFRRLVQSFFAGAAPRSLWERLAEAGFTEEELATVRALLEAARTASPDGALLPLGALLQRGPELTRLLQLTETHPGGSTPTVHRSQMGFAAHRLTQRVGLPAARRRLATLASPLRDALGAERGDALLGALLGELDATEGEIRAYLRESIERRESDETRRETDALANGRLDERAFAGLSDGELEEVRRAVRLFAERLRGGERVRRRRAKAGRLDVHRTLRRAIRTGGVPFVTFRRVRRRDRARLFLLCDVSDSVRDVATFLLEFVYAAQELFPRARTFVFVSELGETTDLFAQEPVRVALGRAYAGAVVSVASNSNYGRVLRAFEARHGQDLTRRDTVVILGDGRTNFHDDGADILGRIRRKARALLWLCPDPRDHWGHGDSAMARYAPQCTRILEVRTARDLEDAVRLLVGLR